MIVTVPVYVPGPSFEVSGVNVSVLDAAAFVVVALSHPPPVVATDVVKSMLPVMVNLTGSGAAVPACPLHDAAGGVTVN